MSQPTGKMVSDVTIVAGLGLTEFHDDDLTVAEPSAASTAGQKTTRNDLLEKRCAEFISKLESKVELAHQTQRPPTWSEGSVPSLASQQQLGHVEHSIAQPTVLTDALLLSQEFKHVSGMGSVAMAPVSPKAMLAAGEAMQKSFQRSTQDQCHPSYLENAGSVKSSLLLMTSTGNGQCLSNSNAKIPLHAPKPGTAYPIRGSACQVKDFCTDSLGSFSSVLGELSPPKSFTQRLWEAKSKPRQPGVVQTAPAGQDVSSKHSDSETELPNQQTVCSSHPKIGATVVSTAAQLKTSGSMEGESLSGELLLSSVLRSLPDESSETWLLKGPEGSKLQQTSLRSSLAGASLHGPTLPANDDAAGGWAAAPSLNYTASDVPWNCPAPCTSLLSDGAWDNRQEAAKLAALLADEQFGELNLRELEEDERLCDTLGHFSPDVIVGQASTTAQFTGLCEVDEITIRESWLGSDAEGVRRVPVDEYLQAGSLALGSLSGNCKRPSFGIHRSLPSSVNSTPRLSLVEETESSTMHSSSNAGRQETRPAVKGPSWLSEGRDQRHTGDEGVGVVRRDGQTCASPPRGTPRDYHSDTSVAAGSCAQSAAAASAAVEHRSSAELASHGCGTRCRGDGGSLSNSGGESKVPQVLPSAPGTSGDAALLHSRVNALSAQSSRPALKKSFSVNTMDASESCTSAVVTAASHYGSLGRCHKSGVRGGWRPQSRSDADVPGLGPGVSRAGQGPDAPRQQAARRGVDAVKAIISNMRENVSPNTARAVVMEAMVVDGMSSVNATLQESVLDASVEINLLRKQKEVIKNRIMKQSSLDEKPAANNVARQTHESRSFPALGHSEMAGFARSSFGELACASSSTAAASAHAKVGRMGAAAHVSSKTQDDGRVGTTTPHEHCEYTELDDTVRLEPCVPSATLQSTICDVTQKEEDNLELEETPALHSLTLCEEPSTSTTSGGSRCVSEPVNVEGCVVGVTTWLSVPLHNPTHDPISMVAKVASETLNSCLVPSSSLIYKHGCITLEPKQSLVWAFGICARGEGVLRCSLELQLRHLASQRPLLTHVVPVTATATLLQVTIGDERPLEVGCVPEGFSYEAQFEVHNRSGRELAVVLSLSQVFSAPVFRLVPPQDSRVLSPSEMACTLRTGTNTFTMSITAPNLCNVGGEAKDSLKISCRLLVKLYSSGLPRPMLASESVSVDVVAVHLHISRACMPLKLEADVDLHASAPLTLKNLSCIPLSLKLRCDFSEKDSSSANVAIVPDHFMIQPNTLASPVVVFTPLGVVTHFTATVVIVVEPYGLEYEVPVEASSVVEERSSGQNNVKSLPKRGSNNKVTTYSSNLGSGQYRQPSPQVALMNPIEASKSRLVFGCLKCGMTAQQKISFYNRNDTSIVLSFGITGSSCFSVVDPEKVNSIVLPAEGTAVILVAFSPTSDEPHSGVLVCKPRGLQQHRIKYSIPLQGYGGAGELLVADSLLQLPAVSDGCPAIVRLALSNSGTRALCVAVSSYADVECSASAEGVVVLPEQLVLHPASCLDVVVVVPGLSDNGGSTGEKMSGVRKLTCLLVRYTEEVLRIRHRSRLAVGCSKALAVSKSSSTDWDAALRGEKLATQQEAGGLPSCPDDAKVFNSSFRQVKVPVMHSAPLCRSDEASVTCFSPLHVDYTLSDSTLRPPDSREPGWPLHGANIPFIPARVDAERNLNRPNQEAYTINNDVPSREKEFCTNAVDQPDPLSAETSRCQSGSVMEKKLLASVSNDLNKPYCKDSEEYIKNPPVVEMNHKHLASHSVSARAKPLLGTTALKSIQAVKTPAPAVESLTYDNNSVNDLNIDACKSNLFEVHGFQKVNKTNTRSSHSENATKHNATRQVLCHSSANIICAPRASQAEQSGPEDESSSHREKEDVLDVNKTFQRIEAVTATHGQPDNDVEDKENYIMNKNSESSGTTATSERASVEVFPPALTVEAGAAAAVVVLNKTTLRRSLQVSCSHPCLVVEPVVAMVGPQGSVSVRLTLQQRLHYITHATLTVKCNEHENVVQVTCLPYLQSTARAGSVAGLQIGQSMMSFPNTSVGKQAYVKLSLKNLSSTTKQVIASVTSGGGSFVVKHPHFQVKVGHFVNVPVYFRPRYAGDHTGELRLAVGGEGELTVQLAGSCI